MAHDDHQGDEQGDIDNKDARFRMLPRSLGICRQRAQNGPYGYGRNAATFRFSTSPKHIAKRADKQDQKYDGRQAAYHGHLCVSEEK